MSDEITAIEEICIACPHQRLGLCRLLPKTVYLAAKIRIPGEKCPEGRWSRAHLRMPPPPVEALTLGQQEAERQLRRGGCCDPPTEIAPGE